MMTRLAPGGQGKPEMTSSQVETFSETPAARCLYYFCNCSIITKPTNTPKMAGDSSFHLLSAPVFRSLSNSQGTIQSGQNMPILPTFWAQKGINSLQEQLMHTTFYLICNYVHAPEKHGFPRSPFWGPPFIQEGHKLRQCPCTRTPHMWVSRSMHSLASATLGAARPCLARLRAVLRTLSRALAAGDAHLRHPSPTHALRKHPTSWHAKAVPSDGLPHLNQHMRRCMGTLMRRLAKPYCPKSTCV